jgi:hypothetical protein
MDVAATFLLGTSHSSLLLVASINESKGPIVQKPDELAEITQSMEDIASTGRVGPGGLLTGPQTCASIGDGGVGSQTLILQLQQTDAPCIGVAVFFEAEQVAEGGLDIGPDEDWLAILKDFIVGTDADGGQVDLGVDVASVFDGIVEDIVDGADGQRCVETVVEGSHDAAIGAVAVEAKGESELSEPLCGDGQMEENM